MNNSLDSLISGSFHAETGASVVEEQVRIESIGNGVDDSHRNLLHCGKHSRLRGSDNIGSGEGVDRLLDLGAYLEDIGSLRMRDLLKGLRDAAALIHAPVALATDAGTVATSDKGKLVTELKRVAWEHQRVRDSTPH